MSRTAWAWARLAGAAVTLPSWSGAWAPARSSTASARSTAGRWRRRPASPLLTTVCCAWRWKIVARGLGVDLPLPAAVAAYYRSQFLNVTLPGGVVGDVHRGVSHGRDVQRRRPRAAGRRLGALRRAGRAGRPDRRRPPRAAVAGALVHAAGRARARRRRLPASRSSAGRGPPAALAMGAAPARRGRRHPRRAARPAGVAGIALASALVVGGHAVTFLIAARTAGTDRAGVADAAARAARDAGHGAAERRRLGAARGRGGVGVRRRRPGRGRRASPPPSSTA